MLTSVIAAFVLFVVATVEGLPVLYDKRDSSSSIAPANSTVPQNQSLPINGNIPLGMNSINVTIEQSIAPPHNTINGTLPFPLSHLPFTPKRGQDHELIARDLPFYGDNLNLMATSEDGAVTFDDFTATKPEIPSDLLPLKRGDDEDDEDMVDLDVDADEDDDDDEEEEEEEEVSDDEDEVEDRFAEARLRLNGSD